MVLEIPYTYDSHSGPLLGDSRRRTFCSSQNQWLLQKPFEPLERVAIGHWWKFPTRVIHAPDCWETAHDEHSVVLFRLERVAVGGQGGQLFQLSELLHLAQIRDPVTVEISADGCLCWSAGRRCETTTNSRETTPVVADVKEKIILQRLQVHALQEAVVDVRQLVEAQVQPEQLRFWEDGDKRRNLTCLSDRFTF